MINHRGKEHEKEYTCGKLKYFIAQQKSIYCKSTTLQLKKLKIDIIYEKKKKPKAERQETVTGSRLKRRKQLDPLIPSRQLLILSGRRPHRRQPIRLPRPRDSPGKNTGAASP